jgi:hypothetical protein
MILLIPIDGPLGDIHYVNVDDISAISPATDTPMRSHNGKPFSNILLKNGLMVKAALPVQELVKDIEVKSNAVNRPSN